MNEKITRIGREWNEKLSEIIHGPPHIGVASHEAKKSRALLNALLDGVHLGEDLDHEKMDYHLSVPFEICRNTFETIQNSLLKLQLVVVIDDESLAKKVEDQWKVKTLVVRGEIDEAMILNIYQSLSFSEATAFAMMSSSGKIKKSAGSEYSRIIALRAAFLGAIPIPIVDIALLLPLQISGVLKIAAIYNHSWNKDRAKELIGLLGGRMAFRAAGRNLAKLIPGLGSVIGAGVAFGGTYALLKTAQIYFERGASLDPKEREVLKKIYRQAEKEGKELFSSDKMKNFRKLQLKYESGVLSREEFEKRMEELGRS